MANKIYTIEDASKICCNNVHAIGELRELSIAINKQNDKVNINYIGVVKVGDSYIKIHGTTTNTSPKFKSDIERLSELKANMYATFEDGKITNTEYSDECSIVYIMGEVSSAHSIRVNYISNNTNADAPRFFGTMTCIPIEIINSNTIKVLVINNHFHNIITLKCEDYNNKLDIMLNKTINFYIGRTCNNENGMALLLRYNNESTKNIPQNIIDSALIEHDIYITTKNNEKQSNM